MGAESYTTRPIWLWEDMGLNDGKLSHPNVSSGYRIYNLDQVGKEVYEGTLVLELGFPPNEATKGDYICLAAQPLRMWKELGPLLALVERQAGEAQVGVCPFLRRTAGVDGLQVLIEPGGEDPLDRPSGYALDLYHSGQKEELTLLPVNGGGLSESRRSADRLPVAESSSSAPAKLGRRLMEMGGLFRRLF